MRKFKDADSPYFKCSLYQRLIKCIMWVNLKLLGILHVTQFNKVAVCDVWWRVPTVKCGIRWSLKLDLVTRLDNHKSNTLKCYNYKLWWNDVSHVMITKTFDRKSTYFSWKWLCFLLIYDMIISCISKTYWLTTFVMRSREISLKSNMWHFQFSIWLNLKYSFGEVHSAENFTWVRQVVPKL